MTPGAGAGASVPSHTQSDTAGHSADRGGADPYRSAHRPHPTPAPRDLQPGLRAVRQEDQRVCDVQKTREK